MTNRNGAAGNAQEREAMQSLKGRIYKGCYHGENSPRGRRVFVLGFQFGPSLFAIGADLEEALSEFDERQGTRVEMTDPALSDYGPIAEAAIEAAMNDGDIRINDGGTMVWVDHYEWVREFPTLREAVRWARET